MSNTVRMRIAKMGRSRGIRIPKSILGQLGWGEEVEMSVRGDQLVIRSSRPPRNGWQEQFRRMAERGDDHLLDAEAVNLIDRDDDDWEWK